MRIRLEKLIKNYFFNTETDQWNYKDFNTYLKLLGYKNEEDIIRIYNNLIKEFVDYNSEDNERNSNRRVDSTDFLYLSENKDCKVIKFIVEIIICKI